MLTAAVAVLSSPMGMKFVNQGVGILVKESWRKVSAFYVQRYGNDKEVQRWSSALDLRLRVIQTPLDFCIQNVAKGNQAMEGARDVAVAILQEIDALQQEITNQEIREGRNEVGDKVPTAGEWAKKLKQLCEKMDAMMPYLNVAIAASSAPEMTTSMAQKPTSVSAVGPNLSRIMQASGQIQLAREKCKQGDPTTIINLKQGSWLHCSPRGVWTTLFLDCSVKLTVECDPRLGQHPFKYKLIVEECMDGDEESGNDSDSNGDPANEPSRVAIDLAGIEGTDWSTGQALNMGEGNWSPFLILSYQQHAPRKDSNATPVPNPHSMSTKYAVQCRFMDDPGTGEPSGSGSVSQEWQVLGDIDYVLRLLIVEVQYGKCHTKLQDSTIRKVFSYESEGGAASKTPQPKAGLPSPLPSPTATASNTGTIEHDLDNLALGSSTCTSFRQGESASPVAKQSHIV